MTQASELTRYTYHGILVIVEGNADLAPGWASIHLHPDPGRTTFTVTVPAVTWAEAERLAVTEILLSGFTTSIMRIVRLQLAPSN